MKKNTSPLTDAVDVAIKSLKAIQVAAGDLDRRMSDAERRAAEAEKKAERDRKAREEAVSVKSSLEAKIIETRASVVAEVETLKAEKEMLAARDRQAREELERLRHSELQRLGQGKQVKSRGITAP